VKEPREWQRVSNGTTSHRHLQNAIKGLNPKANVLQICEAALKNAKFIRKEITREENCSFPHLLGFLTQQVPF